MISLCFSCNKTDDAPRQAQDVTDQKDSASSDSVQPSESGRIAFLESKNTLIESKLDSLSEQKDELAQEFTDLKDSAANRYFVFVAIASGLGLLGFCISLFLLNRSLGKTEKSKIYDRIESYKRDINNIRDELLSVISTRMNSNPNNNQDRKIEQIQNQVDEISKRLDKMDEPTQGIKNITTNDHCGYVGMVKGDGIFNDFNYSKFDEAMFKLEVNGTTAYFEPISLSCIKCVDNIELAIDVRGCERKDAQSMNVKKGLLIKEHDGNWRVKIKANVEFKK